MKLDTVHTEKVSTAYFFFQENRYWVAFTQLNAVHPTMRIFLLLSFSGLFCRQHLVACQLFYVYGVQHTIS